MVAFVGRSRKLTIPTLNEVPIATPDVIGGIRIGDGLTIDVDGIVSVDPAAGADLIVRPAGTSISGHRIVYIEDDGGAYYATNQNLDHAHSMLGMTLGAAALGDPLTIKYYGEVEESSWNWTLHSPVYLGDNGLLTQTPPTSPALFHRIVGFPLAPTILFVSFRDPIILSS